MELFIKSPLSDDFLYDGLRPTREYMLHLEKQLMRIFLLNELWGLRHKTCDPNWWKNQVSNYKSVETMALLLVRLIDDTLCRAFIEEWNKTPGVQK